MRFTWETTPIDHEHSCALLEAFAEGIVLANMLEIQAEDEEDEFFPCCIKCGKFQLFVDREVVDGAREIVKRGGGNALALACYQVAQLRIEKDAHAQVIIEYVEVDGRPVPGEYRPMVMLDDEIQDPLAEVQRNGDCGCGREVHD